MSGGDRDDVRREKGARMPKAKPPKKTSASNPSSKPLGIRT